MSIWSIMIILHAFSATVCFAIGLIIIAPRRVEQRTWLFTVFLLSLVGLISFIVGAIISHWYATDVSERIIFSGLVALGLYMLYRGLHARTYLTKKPMPQNYIDDIGFILISLFNGFVIVGLLDLHLQVLLVVTATIAATVLGSRLIKLIKQRYSATMTA